MSDTPRTHERFGARAAARVDGDLVARLRKRAEGSSGFGPTLSEEAADEIERLRAALRDVVACSLIDEPTTDVMIDALDRAREVLGDE